MAATAAGRRRAHAARQQRAFVAVFGSDTAAEDALFWLDHPGCTSPNGTPSPAAELGRLRVELYQPDPAPGLQQQYEQALARTERLQSRTAEAVAASSSKPVLVRPVRVAGALGLVVAAGTVALLLNPPLPRPTGPQAPPNVSATVQTIPLTGTARDAARLSAEIRAGRGDSTALVTRTAYTAIPVLQATNRAAGNEAVLRGSTALNLDALEQLPGPRTVSVLVVCTTPTEYRWTLLASRLRTGGPAGPRVAVAHGSGKSCSRGMDAATVRVPRNWYPDRIRLSTAADRRYLLSVQVVA